MRIFEDIKKLLTGQFYESSNNVFIKPLDNKIPHKKNQLQIMFPQQDMTPEDKVIYSLAVEGDQSIITLKMLTGLPRVEIDQALGKLVESGKIKNKNFYSDSTLSSHMTYSYLKN